MPVRFRDIRHKIADVLAAQGGGAVSADTWLTLYGVPGVPAGPVYETFPRQLVAGGNGSFTPASGTIYNALIGLPAGFTVTNISTLTGNLTLEAGGTHGWYALADKTGKILAVTADTVGNMYTANNAVVTKAVTAPYLTPTGDHYYILMSVTCTTSPVLYAGSNPTLNVNNPSFAGLNIGGAGPPLVGSTIVLGTGLGPYLYAYVS